MGSSMLLIAGENDRKALEVYAVTLGTHFLPSLFDMELPDDPHSVPGGYMSLVSKSLIVRSERYPERIHEVLNPVLRYDRPYFRAPYLVIGRISWNNDALERNKIVGPYYRKFYRWIRKNFSPILPGPSVYIGPEAMRLVEEGAEVVNFHPDHHPDNR